MNEDREKELLEKLDKMQEKLDKIENKEDNSPWGGGITFSP